MSASKIAFQLPQRTKTTYKIQLIPRYIIQLMHKIYNKETHNPEIDTYWLIIQNQHVLCTFRATQESEHCTVHIITNIPDTQDKTSIH